MVDVAQSDPPQAEKRQEDQKERSLPGSKKQGNGFVKVSQILRETKGNCKNDVKNIQNMNDVFGENR